MMSGGRSAIGLLATFKCSSILPVRTLAALLTAQGQAGGKQAVLEVEAAGAGEVLGTAVELNAAVLTMTRVL